MLDGGAPFYDVYVCKDGGFMSVGCLEPRFYNEFIRLFVGALPREYSLQNGWKPTTNAHIDRDEWPNLKEFLEKGFMTNTRDYWSNVFHGATPLYESRTTNSESVYHRVGCVCSSGAHTGGSTRLCTRVPPGLGNSIILGQWHKWSHS